ncbi:platelet-activating factor acetylhydrolase isoform II [Bradyrhizobium daqingense]|uniref:Platelet-activating factor acetylhydrolase isoform II n=1 Tax=Bradyrhizobium daqingense TaxID=993502 RepID=A0A562LTS5_9BRAD|nr:platelet-activating factor acetylhydrolase isoform II [Bradyrhizobium daqingense]
MRRTLWAFAITLCCLGSSADAAGIQLLQSDPALSGAIWYPCAMEPAHVALGNLSVGADFGLQGVKDCPVAGEKLPLVIVSHGRGGWFGQHHDTVEALADAGFVVAAINHPVTHTATPRAVTPCPSGNRVRPTWCVCARFRPEGLEGQGGDRSGQGGLLRLLAWRCNRPRADGDQTGLCASRQPLQGNDRLLRTAPQRGDAA